MKKFYLSFIAMLMTVIGMQAATSDVLYIVGNKMPAKWTWTDQSAMTKVSEGVFTYTGQFAATTGKDGFQFMTTASWSGNVNRMIPASGENTTISTGTYDLMQSTSSSNKDMVFNLDTAGDYKITVDQNTMKMTVEEATEPVYGNETIYMYGLGCDAGNSWVGAQQQQFKYIGDNCYQWTGNLYGDKWVEFICNQGKTKCYNCTASSQSTEPLKDNAVYNIVEGTSPRGFKVESDGKYELTLNLTAMTVSCKLAVDTGVDEVAADADAPVEYYNLQGVRVENPANGLYIRRQGGKASKVIVK